MYIMYLLHTKNYLDSQNDFRMCLINSKGIEFLPQTLIFLSLYLCNTIEFVAKTQSMVIGHIYLYMLPIESTYTD